MVFYGSPISTAERDEGKSQQRPAQSPSFSTKMYNQNPKPAQEPTVVLSSVNIWLPKMAPKPRKISSLCPLKDKSCQHPYQKWGITECVREKEMALNGTSCPLGWVQVRPQSLIVLKPPSLLSFTSS
jgi:hypothetical protein